MTVRRERYSQSVRVRLATSDRAALCRAAGERGMTECAAVRAAIKAWLEQAKERT